MRRVAIIVMFLAVGLLFLPARGNAVVLFNDFGEWQAFVGTYEMADLSGYSDFSTISAGTPIPIPFDETLTFDVDMEARTVGTTWNSIWDGGRTPKILWTGYGNNTTTGYFAPDYPEAFGFFAQPNEFGSFDIELVLPDGTTLLQNIDNWVDAGFFGWAGGQVTSMTITVYDTLDAGFAIGEFVKAPHAVVPEPGTLMLLGAGLVGLAGLRKKFKI